MNSSVNFMAGLLTDIDNIEEGRPTVNTNPADVAEQYAKTRALLESLNDIGMDYGSPVNVDEQVPVYDLNDDPEYMNDKLSSLYGTYIPQPGEEGYDEIKHSQPPIVENNHQPHHYQPQESTHNVYNKVQNNTYTPGQNWVIIEDPVPGAKSSVIYSIKSYHTHQVILDNIMMKESALALRNLLNEGRTLSDPKMLGLISSGIQYTKVMNTVIDSHQKRATVLRECRYDDAKELDVVIEEQKQKALELKKKVLKFLQDEGYIE